MSLAFFLSRWSGDGDLCNRAITSIRRYYPQADLVLIVDGLLEQGDTLGLELASTVIYGEQLFSAEHGGAWALRWIRAALEHSNADTLVRLDPDSLMIRPIKSYPDFDIFGSLMTHPQHGQFVQGGACGYQRSALEQIEASGLLEQERMKNMHYLNVRANKLCVLDDVQVSVCAKELNLTLGEWGEVRSRGAPAYAMREIGSSRAVWHPVRLD